jgi:hypothetical protein
MLAQATLNLHSSNLFGAAAAIKTILRANLTYVLFAFTAVGGFAFACLTPPLSASSKWEEKEKPFLAPPPPSTPPVQKGLRDSIKTNWKCA